MGWMPTDSKTRFAMGLPTMEEHESGQKYEEARSQRGSAELRAQIAAEAQLEAERIRQGYNQGGAVYKHAHPTYIKFGKTADSSLLAKGRK
jgi:hypothetical protein